MPLSLTVGWSIFNVDLNSKNLQLRAIYVMQVWFWMDGEVCIYSDEYISV